MWFSNGVLGREGTVIKVAKAFSEHKIPKFHLHTASDLTQPTSAAVGTILYSSLVLRLIDSGIYEVYQVFMRNEKKNIKLSARQ